MSYTDELRRPASYSPAHQFTVNKGIKWKRRTQTFKMVCRTTITASPKMTKPTRGSPKSMPESCCYNARARPQKHIHVYVSTSIHILS